MNSQHVGTYGYDTDGRVAQLETTGTHQLGYQYNNTDTVQRINDLIYGTQTTAYGYDANDRVTSASNSVFGSYGYDWDEVGNRRSQTATGGTLSHTMNGASNRLAALNGSQSRSIGYDAQGNVTSESRWDGTRAYGYDAFNRMNQVRINGQIVGSYQSNALNQRVVKTTAAGNSGFIYGPGGEQLVEVANGVVLSYAWLGGDRQHSAQAKKSSACAASGFPRQREIWRGKPPLPVCRPAPCCRRIAA